MQIGRQPTNHHTWRGASFVGTFDREEAVRDEMIRMGLGQKTGRRMGHIPVNGADGSLAALA